MYRILTFDGGGIRGIFTAVILDRLLKMQPKLLDQVDLIAGTSTGGILALGLASGLKPAELIEFYQTDGPAIFGHKRRFRSLWGLVGPHYKNDALHAALTKYMRVDTLKELQKKVLIPTFALSTQYGTWRPKIYHNLTNRDGNQKVIDVAMRTSAAPIYFPSYQEYIDGGIVANNPSMAALTQALGSHELTDLVVLSLGTGRITDSINGSNHHWGLMQWGTKLINIVMDAPVEMADYQCRRLLKNRYARISPPIPPIPLDATKKMSTLIDLANQVNLDWVGKWMQVYFNENPIGNESG